MVKAKVNAGICGFITDIQAESDDNAMVTMRIDSPCENIRGLAKNLAQIDAYSEIGAGFNGVIHHAALASLKGCCSGCIVPGGIFKTMQVAASLALPQTASIEIEKREIQS
jgi:hypothetical protein